MTSPTWRVICADVLDGLAQLPDESVQCVVTSPPYWGLRDYGTAEWDGGDAVCDHVMARARNDAANGRHNSGTFHGSMSTEHGGGEAYYPGVCGKCGAVGKDRQLGLEPTPEAYVERMVAVFREVRRVLRPDGTVWLNLGDAYGSGTRASRDYSRTTKHGYWNNPGIDKRLPSAAKQLLGMPWRVAFALQADGWYLRSDIIWSKPNPMPESVTDRPTKAHEYVFLLTRSSRYFYDADAVREPHKYPEDTERFRGIERGADQFKVARYDYEQRVLNPAGRNLRSVWSIATEPYPEAHFATFPKALVVPCVKAGTSEKGCCPECGAAWRRVVELPPNAHPGDSGSTGLQGKVQRGKRPDGLAVGTAMRERYQAGRDPITLGWKSSCAHTAEPIPCTVLDPFAGSGTVGVVALRHGRSFVGIELNPTYAEMARRRIADDAPLFNVQAEVTDLVAEG